MSAKTVCQYFKYGFCKRGPYCWKQHVEIKCESCECDGSKCDKRHPRECRFYSDYGRCKFGEFCLYNHIDRIDPVLGELKLVNAKLDMVEVQIVEKNLEMKLLFEKLELALRIIIKEEVFKEHGDATTEDEKEKSPEINAEGDSGIEANSQGYVASNDKEDKLGMKIGNKKSNKDKNDNNRAGNYSEEKENNNLVANRWKVKSHDDEDRLDSKHDWNSQPRMSYTNEVYSVPEVDKIPPLFEKGERSWTCLCCRFIGEFETEALLEAHHSIHSIEYNECDKCFIPPDIQCFNCDTVFGNKKLLSEHYVDHQAGCEDCRKCFSSCLEAEQHEHDYHPEGQRGVWKLLHHCKDFLLLLMARPPSFSFELMTLVLSYMVVNLWFGLDFCGPER